MALSVSLLHEATHADGPSVTIGQSDAKAARPAPSNPDSTMPASTWIPVGLLIGLCLAAGYLFWAKVTFHWPF